jgi:hypothetical protein
MTRAAPPTDIPPVVFSDFTPGIADLPGISYPTCQATRTNTYRCLANPSGSLGPGPRRDYSLAGNDFDDAAPQNGYFCSGIYVSSPILPSAGASSADGRAHELWIATEWDTTAAGNTKKRRLERVRLFESAPTRETIYTNDTATSSGVGTATCCTFAQTRANTVSPVTPGIPVLAISWYADVAANSINYEFPDNTTPTLNTPFAVHTSQALVITHQGRFVYRFISAYDHGVNGRYSTTEDLKWGDVNNPQAALSALQAFYPEQADGYALMASMSANELFCLKEQGALVIVGDLALPTITNLPMVEGSGFMPQAAGLRTPLGFLYSARSGLHSWTHGDAAELISPVMDPDFHRITSEVELFGGQSYSWYYTGGLAFLSNNFIFDTRTKSFWRLEDINTMQLRWMTGARQFVYGAKSEFSHADTSLIYGWNLDDGASSYSWQSHPIWESVDRVVAIDEIELIAQGQGTIRLTLTGLDGSTRSVLFELKNPGFPERFRSNFAIQGKYLQLRIEADSLESTADAPTVYSVVVHPSTRQPISVSR